MTHHNDVLNQSTSSFTSAKQIDMEQQKKIAAKPFAITNGKVRASHNQQMMQSEIQKEADELMDSFGGSEQDSSRADIMSMLNRR